MSIPFTMLPAKRRMIDKTNNNSVFCESFGLCPFLREIEREKKRTAEIAERKRMLRDTEDIPERELEHIRIRDGKPTKEKWVRMLTKFAKDIQFSGPMEQEQMRKYLQESRNSLDRLNRREKEKKWTRTEKIRFAEKLFEMESEYAQETFP